MTATRFVLGASVALLLSHSSSAHADYSKAWAAAKDNLPTNTRAILVGDVALATKTSTFNTILPLILSEEKDFEQGLALIKGSCKIDALTAVSGFVLAADPENEKGVVYLQLSGLDRPKLETCITNVLKLIGEKNATVKKDGQFTEVSNGHDSVYFAWVTADVIAITIDPDKKADLQVWFGQKGSFAKSPVQALLSKVDVKAPAWGAVSLTKPLDDNDMPVTTARGSMSFGAGTIAGEIVGTLESPVKAAATIAKIKKDQAKELARKSTPAAVKKVIKALTFKAAGSDVSMKGKVSEKDLAAAIQATFK